MKRTRTCSQPQPQYRGKPCKGSAYFSKKCEHQRCPRQLLDPYIIFFINYFRFRYFFSHFKQFVFLFRNLILLELSHFKRHSFCAQIQTRYEGSYHVVMVKVLGCNIVVSEFKLQSCHYVHFRTNTLWKSMTPLSPQLWVKWNHCCSTIMVLVLNNPEYWYGIYKETKTIRRTISGTKSIGHFRQKGRIITWKY